MKKEYDIGYAVFGTPNGLQYKSYGVISKYDISKIIDLISTQIRVYAGTSLYLVKREIIKNKLITYYIKYGYAKEMNNNREGTFYGCLFVLVEAKADGDKINDFLDDLNDKINFYIDGDSRFINNINSIDFGCPNLDALLNSIVPLEYHVDSIGQGKSIIALRSDEKTVVSGFYDRAINPSITKKYGYVYSTSSKKILEYTYSKGIVRNLRYGDIKSLELEEENAILKRENAILIEKNRGLLSKYNKIKKEYSKILSKSKESDGSLSEGRILEKEVMRKSKNKNDLKVRSDKNNSYKKQRFDEFAEKVMNNSIGSIGIKRIIQLLVALLLLLLVVAITKKVSNEDRKIKQIDGVGLKNDARDDLMVENNIDKDEAIILARDYIKKVKKSKYIYDLGELEGIKEMMKKVHADNVNEYEELLRLKQNYAKTGRSLSDLEKRIYIVKSYDEKMAAIKEYIITEDPKAKEIGNMMFVLKNVNKVNLVNPLYDKGDTVFYYVDKE